MHFRTWVAYEADYLRRANGIVPDAQQDVGGLVREIRNRFGLARSTRNGYSLKNEDCQRYGEAILGAIQDVNDFELCVFADAMSTLSDQQSFLRVTGGIQKSMATKVAWFFRPQGFTIYDSHARCALGANGFQDYYCKLNCLGFSELCYNLRGLVEASSLPTLRPERIIDKMLWIMGDNDPCEHLITDPVALNPILGQPLADQINALTEALCPRICGSKLGIHLLTKPCFRIPEAT